MIGAKFVMKTMKELEQLIAQMTLEEKVGQLILVNSNLFGPTDAEITGPAREFGISPEELKRVGCVLNFHGAEDMTEIQKRHLEEDRNKIPLIFMMDVIHGFKTSYPIPLAMGASFDPDLMEDCASFAAKEAAAGGVHVTYAPMIDYVRDARWGRVMETCGEDPYLNSVMGAAQVRGYQGDDVSHPEKIAACVKHFAAYGGSESGKDYNTVELSERLLREYYFPAYKACFDAGAKMVMPSFNSINGVPSTVNKWLMKDVLADEWGFDGAVVSDYNAIEELTVHGVADSLKSAAKMAFDCGCHMGMMSNAYHEHLAELVREGTISEAALDDAVMHILKLKNELGLFDDPYHGASAEKCKETFLSPESRAFVRNAAEQCAVLLKNDGILPLSESCGKVALIGPFASTKTVGGEWSCHAKDPDCVSLEEGIKNLLGGDRVTVVEGCSARHDERSTAGFAEAVRAAEEADTVILCLGEPQRYSGEANCRTDLGLPGVQMDLAREVIRANPNTAVVLLNGRPLSVPALDLIAPAILEIWFSGCETGNAAANLLFGRANPSGKVSMSFPKSVGQCPIYYNHPSTGRPKTTAEDQFQYCASNYIDCGNLPLYSFGYGLSYSKFVYESLTLDADTLTKDSELTVSVTLRNDGVPGKEVVQLYMRDLVASTVRPIQSLIAFEKVSLGTGERKTVQFKVKEPMLRFYDFNCNFISEPGEFELSTGYADHLILTEKFLLK